MKIEDIDLKALERDLRAEYEEDLRAIKRVKQILARKGKPNRECTEALQDLGDESANSLVEKGGAPDTLISAVAQILAETPGKQWTSRTMEDHMRITGYVFESKEPRLSINTALARLCKRGAAHVLVTGVGKMPTMYIAAGVPLRPQSETPGAQVRELTG